MLLASATLVAWLLAAERAGQSSQSDSRLRIFLDCSGGACYEDFLREEVTLGQYVRDRTDADVHVLMTRAQTGAGGHEYTLAFIGLGSYATTARTLKVTTEASDSEDRIRRQLASALTLGLLSYLAPTDLPPGLAISATVDGANAASSATSGDPWRRWLFNLNAFANLESEESTSQRNWGLSGGADRITPQWKVTFGVNVSENRDEFDLDDGSRLAVVRENRAFNWLTVRSLGDHWSAGATGRVRSSTFDNTRLAINLSPAIEWNFFPYAMYTRRQFRVQYAIGGSRFRYYEETLYGRVEETRARQELSATFEQREPWGTLEGRVEASNYFPGLSTHRLEVDGEVDVRVTRGLSVSIEASASRIRDQLALPRRDASSEEVLLRLRQLQSDFEARFEIGIQYRFGSRFAAIVNPRFGQ
ncbi:MAG: hypothetical protein H0T71_10605 [Acidobacteria bacterium]|nr:hypothetical protein [Acidobacteriota bacterium]